MTSHRTDRSAGAAHADARPSRKLMPYAGVSIVVLAVLAVVVVVILVTRRDSSPETPRAEDTEQSQTSEPTESESPPAMTLPESTGKWTIFSTPEARTEIKQVLKGREDAIAGFYVHDSAPHTPVFFVGINAQLDDGPATESIERLLGDASVAKPKTYDAGPGGGVLACGDAGDRGKDWVTCAWVTEYSTALMRWPDRSVRADRAAELTMDFRALTGG